MKFHEIVAEAAASARSLLFLLLFYFYSGFFRSLRIMLPLASEPMTIVWKYNSTRPQNESRAPAYLIYVRK